MAIEVHIEGAKDSPADYDDEAYLAADASVRMAVQQLYESGGTVANIVDAVKGGLEDAEAEA